MAILLATLSVGGMILGPLPLRGINEYSTDEQVDRAGWLMLLVYSASGIGLLTATCLWING